MLEDKLRLQQQANSLEERLEAVLHDKFHAKTFDAETPIDKTLAFLHSVIKVSSLSLGGEHADALCFHERLDVTLVL